MKTSKFRFMVGNMQRTDLKFCECNDQTFYAQRSLGNRPPLYGRRYIITNGILILYFLLLTNVIVIFLKYPPNLASRGEDLLQQPKKSSNTFHSNQKVCREIFQIQEKYVSKSNEALKFFSKLSFAQKDEHPYIWYDFYYLLGKMIPSIVTETEFHPDVRKTKYEIQKKSRLDRMNWKIPYLPCRLREYTDEDVNTCIRKRSLDGKQFRITYMGDSRVRRQMEYLLELLHQFNLTITTFEGETLTLNQFFGDKGTVLWPKYKHKLSVRSSLLPTFEINYIWAPFLSRGDSEYDEVPHLKYRHEKIFSSMFPLRQSSFYSGDDEFYIKILKSNSTKGAALRYRMQSGKESGAFDELTRLNKKPKSEIPDFFVVDTSAWLLSNRELQDILHNIDKWAVSGTLKLHKIIKKLSAKATVIILLPSPFKDALRFTEDGFSYFDLQSNKNQQWYLNAQIQMWPRNVIKWDTFIPVAFASNDDCYKVFSKKIDVTSFPKIQRFDHQNSYSCDSRIHSGYEAIGVAVQMLLNQICNDYMDRQSDSYCCES